MINQILDGDIRDALYAASSPSAANPIATMADVGGGSTVVNTNEPTLTADVTVTESTTGVYNLLSKTYIPVTDGIGTGIPIDGHTRELVIAGNFSRSGGPGASMTFRVRFTVAGTAINMPSIPIVGGISNATWKAKISINYRAGSIVNVVVEYSLFDHDVLIAQQFDNVIGITWDQALSNNVDFDVQIQSTSGADATWTVETFSSILTPLVLV